MPIRFAVIDGCAVPSAIADEIREVKRRTGATLVSCDRSDEAEPILNANGKQTQEQLYNGFVRGLPGYNPANPPGRSTHERRSDAVAYPGPVGRKLKPYQVGMDWDIPHVRAVIKAFAELGWIATVTYPTSARERQHVNVRRKGREFVPFQALKRGSRGARVAYLRWALGFVHDPDTGQPYLSPRYRLKALSSREDRTFGGELETALRYFQSDWGHKPDGIYGRQTAAQLRTRVRARRQKNRAAKRPRR